jgi:hypothetical protein
LIRLLPMCQEPGLALFGNASSYWDC